MNIEQLLQHLKTTRGMLQIEAFEDEGLSDVGILIRRLTDSQEAIVRFIELLDASAAQRIATLEAQLAALQNDGK